MNNEIPIIGQQPDLPKCTFCNASYEMFTEGDKQMIGPKCNCMRPIFMGDLKKILTDDFTLNHPNTSETVKLLIEHMDQFANEERASKCEGP